LGITGGIATGKSSFAKLLAIRLPATLFDADSCARQLLMNDKPVLQRVRESFGSEVFTPEGGVDRTILRQIVFASDEKRRALEEILHPPIRARWFPLAEKNRASGGWLLVDIPLLFETGAGQFFDTIIVVACQASTQIRRLMEIRKLSREMAGKMISAQIDLNIKVSKASHLAWNDGSISALEGQAVLISDLLKKRHG
jgi:dephospho-CoA kinase